MASRHHTHWLPYTPEQLYDLVVDIQKYPYFLPSCLDARILSQSETEIIADLVVGYKLFCETFRSRVLLTPSTRIEVEYVKGPFQHLRNHWEFRAVPDGGTEVDFFIDFAFRNNLFQKASQVLFDVGFGTLLEAFEKRAHALYGNPSNSQQHIPHR